MLTVFTPAYNRCHTLPKTYESLCQQTCQDFIWLIVDDGSTDGTRELVQMWLQESKIRINYHYQSNSGKMRAHNQGILSCHTELFVCVDSDDYLVDDAVEHILETWNSLAKTDHLAGIVAYKGKDPSHAMFGESFPDVTSATLQELYQKGFFGETTLIFRTDVLSQNLFPEFEGEKFIPEAVVYDRIDAHYQLQVLPKVLTICEYQDEGLTRSIDILRENNPQGWLLYYQQRIKNSSYSVLRYKYLAHAVCFCWRLKLSPFKEIPASKPEILGSFLGAVLLKAVGKL